MKVPLLQDIPFHNRFWLQIGLPVCILRQNQACNVLADWSIKTKINDTFLSE